MRNLGRALVLGALLAATTAGPAAANNNPNGMSFRSVGWFKGRSTVSAGSITCEIPTVTSAIGDGSFALGLWNTLGVQTLYFPDINNPFANPCGVWIQMQNNLIDQAIVVDHVSLVFKITGAKRFRRLGIPTRNGWPFQCRRMRKTTLFVGARLNPINSTQDTSQAGAPNVAFIQLLPVLAPETIHCLRDVYTQISAAPPTAGGFVSLPIVATATPVGVSDAGDTFKANPIRYTVNLRHTCGNGRVDDGELCDPNAPSTCIGFCKIAQGETTGTCSHNENIGCRTDADCSGTCMAPNQPSECICVY
ncbi:MAG TPA: hypothetical protein VFD84_20775 [Candidatus Binatia bacterium]|jgi:hypothetical protein|nr:hypothetical protein [Candidatus Binatia bacterium]